MLTEYQLNNIFGGLWGFDIIVSIISTVGCAIMGHNRKEPSKDISASSGFVVVEDKPKDKNEWTVIKI